VKRTTKEELHYADPSFSVSGDFALRRNKPTTSATSAMTTPTQNALCMSFASPLTISAEDSGSLDPLFTWFWAYPK
jgi:hypothetical protein